MLAGIRVKSKDLPFWNLVVALRDYFPQLDSLDILSAR